ncbi:MAG TPA: poly-gamma-glutamate system protein [Candidatus Eisenbacteria bacterium]
MSLSRASTPALVGLACLAFAAYAVAERSRAPAHAEAYRMKLRAVRLMEDAEEAIRAAKHERGVAIDARNDEAGSGVVGPEFTLITTDRGAQASKSLAAHPNFAAAVTQMMLQARVREGDLVAVGLTGSLPGMNLAVLSACRAIGAEPVVVTSAGSSMFGATDPEMTWLDMEAVTAAKGLWPYRSLAASLGGGGDVGRGLSPAGRQLLADAIERNGARLLDPPSVLAAVKERVALYDSVAAARRRPIALYVNVGGGAASLGGTANARLIRPGLNRRLATRNYPNRGVINVMAERRIPVLHLLQVETLARQYGITDASSAPEKPGEGVMFRRDHYNLWVVGGAALLVLLSNLFVLRLDIRQQVLGQPHPERVSPS